MKRGARVEEAFRACVIACLVIGCAPIPKPRILDDLDSIARGPSAAEARSLAPGAFAHAEKLRRDAASALSAGDQAGAQILAERALGAYAHAAALVRIVRAETLNDESETRLANAKQELAQLDAEQIRVAAEADALELKVRVARDAQPIQPSDKAEPERERARLAAARALALQARLLCAGARLLVGGAGQDATKPPAQLSHDGATSGPNPRAPAELGEADAALAKLEEKLAPNATGAPIDEASRVRAGCLAALTAIRRAATPIGKAPGAGDALLAAISATGSFTPSRDDRGVVITLRGLFAGAGTAPSLTAAGEARLIELGKIAAAHPSFPVEVIVHHDRPVSSREEAPQRARAESVAKAIAAAAKGVKVEPIVAGNAAPVVDPAGADRSRNARVEIVFVTPESF